MVDVSTIGADAGASVGRVSPRDNDAAVARIVMRLSSEYVLRTFQLLIDNYGDIRAGLVARVVHAANTAHLDPRSEEGRRAARPDGILPDEKRRPISIARLADSARLPFESTRRIVHGLVDAGECALVEGGVIVPSAALERPSSARMPIANLGYVRRFVRELESIGVAEAGASVWLPDEAPDEFRLGRDVARVTVQYFLRALQLLVETFGDIRIGIVGQTIIAANTAHLDERGGEGWRYAGVDQPTPDALRRPISAARLAESLGLPYETVRGQVQRLIEKGVCRRVEGGLIVPMAVTEGPGAIQAMLANVAYVRRLLRDLKGMAPSRTAAARPNAAHERFARDQNVRRYASLLESEQSLVARDRLRRLLIAEEDQFGSLVQRLDRTNQLIAEAEARISRMVLQLRRGSGAGSDPDRGERLVANMRDMVAIAKDYRRTLLDGLERNLL